MKVLIFASLVTLSLAKNDVTPMIDTSGVVESETIVLHYADARTVAEFTWHQSPSGGCQIRTYDESGKPFEESNKLEIVCHKGLKPILKVDDEGKTHITFKKAN